MSKLVASILLDMTAASVAKPVQRWDKNSEKQWYSMGSINGPPIAKHL